MATQPVQSEVFRLDTLFRSDMLPTLRPFFDASPDLKLLFERRLLQIRLIVDANRIYAELLWRLSKREDPRNRSGLVEAIDAGLLVLIAPKFLNNEIEKHLPRIAEKAGTAVDEASREWELLRGKLRFYVPSSQPTSEVVVDPKDLPYKYASDELGLPVYTMDSDLREMGAPVVWACIDTACRDHARATSVTLGFTMGSTYTLTIGAEALKEAARGIKSLFDGFRRLSPWLQIAIAGGLAAILIHPKSRAKLAQTWSCVRDAALRAQGPALEGFLVVMRQLAEAESSARNTRQQIQAALPAAQKATAIVYARRVCVLSPTPLTTSEIARRMRNEGYVPRGRDPEAYLRRVLRQSCQFVSDSSGMWTLQN
jgi:predicted nucleic acid-binding protein